MRRPLAIAALIFAGCGAEIPAPEGAPTGVVVTNFVNLTRLVVVTNTVCLTNTAVQQKEPERTLSLRRTAPYFVSGRSLGPGQLRALASAAGARVVECGTGALALVEASDVAAETLRTGGVLSVFPLSAKDKIAAGAGGAVRIVPMSAIDVGAVVDAVRSCGGEILQVTSAGSPAVRAKVSFAAMKKLAGRGDVRRIERDGR